MVGAKICRLRCVMLISVFMYMFLFKTSRRVVAMKLKVNNFILLIKTLGKALRKSNDK